MELNEDLLKFTSNSSLKMVNYARGPALLPIFQDTILLILLVYGQGNNASRILLNTVVIPIINRLIRMLEYIVIAQNHSDKRTFELHKFKDDLCIVSALCSLLVLFTLSKQASRFDILLELLGKLSTAWMNNSSMINNE